MSLIKRLLGKQEPKPRTRVCIECGMSVAEHKECSILRGQNAMKRAAEPQGS